MDCRHTVVFVVLVKCRDLWHSAFLILACLICSNSGVKRIMVIDLDCTGRLFENPLPDEHGNGPKNKTLSASHTANNMASPHNLTFPTSTKQLPSNGRFWSPLKAIPLFSFYKLHRVPSLTAMAEPGQDDAHTIELPRSEPTSNPELHHTRPQNGIIHNKLLEQVVRTPGRQPSPQPTHLSVPGPSQHRVLHEEGSGYVAPKFEGKELQMDQGTCRIFLAALCYVKLT